MKTVFRVLTVGVALAASWASASDDDRQLLLDHLQRSSDEFTASVRGLSMDQWNYKPSAEVWSIAECAEHIILSEDLMRDMIHTKVLAGPARKAVPPNDRKALDRKVVETVTDRNSKAKAPEQLQPTRRFASPEAAIQAFRTARAKTVELVKERNDLRNHVGPHPVLKELDAHQWLLYLSGHTMRHTAQIREVRSAPRIPGGQ